MAACFYRYIFESSRLAGAGRNLVDTLLMIKAADAASRVRLARGGTTPMSRASRLDSLPPDNDLSSTIRFSSAAHETGSR